MCDPSVDPESEKKSSNWASQVAQTVKNPPVMWETWVQSLGWEDPLEEDMETYQAINLY